MVRMMTAHNLILVLRSWFINTDFHFLIVRIKLPSCVLLLENHCYFPCFLILNALVALHEWSIRSYHVILVYFVVNIDFLKFILILSRSLNSTIVRDISNYFLIFQSLCSCSSIILFVFIIFLNVSKQLVLL